MWLSKFPMTMTALLAVGLLAAETGGQNSAEKPRTEPAAGHAGVQQVLAKFQALRPDDKDLAVFRLDWVPTLKDAKEKAAREQRPILLLVVTNSYGNLYTGHC